MGILEGIASGAGGFLGSIAGGIFGSEAQRDAMKSNEAIAGANAALQREFAQNGIRWKVEDAKQAGVHPVYALGAQTHSFNPVAIQNEPDMSWSNAFRDMGQSVDRAIHATRTADERLMTTLQIQSLQADVEGKALDNQIRASTLNNMNKVGPPMPGSTNFMPGQGDSAGLVSVKAKERTAHQPGRPAQEAGWVPDVGFSRTDTGLTPVVPQGLSESLEDDLIGKAQWRLRNQLLPNFTGEGKPPRNQLPRWADDWDYSFTRQQWEPVKGEGSYPWKRWSDGVTRWQKNKFWLDYGD